MAINDKLIVQEAAAAGGDSDPNILLDLNAGDVDSYDGDGDVWYDIHDFEYKPTTNVAQHFNTVLYTGDGNDKTITDVGFQPDFVWIKARTASDYNIIFDSVRGAGNRLVSSLTIVQDTGGGYGVVDSFNSLGFTTDVQTSVTPNNIGRDGIKYVAWCFKAGGAPVLNQGGDIDSQVSVNNDLGFSIVKWTGDGSASSTVGHGLDSTPELLIAKSSTIANDWWVGAKNVDGVLQLNNNLGTITNSGSNGFLAKQSTYTSSAFGFTSGASSVNNANKNGEDYIAYAFTSKRGVSKVGSYIGDGGTSNRIYTGFEPAFVLQKRTDNTSNWRIFDNVRGTEKELYANTTAQEPSDVAYIDFNRDGFTLTNSGAWINGNTNKYIYYAVAKNTNETSLIAPGTNLKLGLDAGTYSGSGNWLDSSGNSNNGVITGATWEQELGNFFEFNAAQNDKISVASSTAIQSATSYSIESWINPTTFSGIPHLWSIFGSGNKSFCYINDTNGNVNFTVYNDSSSNSLITNSTVKLKLNKWNHVMCTVGNGGFLKVYINGEEAGSISQTGTQLTTGTSPFLIGALGGYTDYDFTGGIGQVRLYSAVLSLDDVRQNFNFTKPRYPNEFHGAITGASFVQASGTEVDHFLFDGISDYITIDAKSSSPVNFSNDFTISVWVNPTVINATHQIFTKYGSTTDLQSVTLGILVDGKVNSTLKNVSASVNLRGAAGAVTTSGGWYHIVLVREGTNNSLYINQNTPTKSAYATNTSPLVNTGGTQPIIIGGQTTGTTNEFDGFISKVKLYNAALTTTQITALYNEGE